MDLQWILEIIICFATLGQLIAGDLLYAITSRDVIIKPQFKGHIKAILWTHNGHKAIEWSETDSSRRFREFEDRTELNTTTGDITIKNLTIQQSGIYNVEVEIDGKEWTFKQNVKVMDPVQPIIICEINNTSVATLTCSASGPQVTYKWFGPGQENVIWSPEGNGSSLRIDPSESAEYTCLAENPVSKKNQSFNAKDCPSSEQSWKTKLIWLSLVFICVILGLLIFVFIRIRKVKRRNQNGESAVRRSESRDVAALQSDTCSPGHELTSVLSSETDKLILGPGENVAEVNLEPLVKDFLNLPGEIYDAKHVNMISPKSEEKRTIAAEDVVRQMLPEQKTGTWNSNVAQALQFSPEGQPPPKPPRRPGSIRVPYPTLVGDTQSDLDASNYAKQSYSESPVRFPATRGAGEDEGEKREMSVEEGLDNEEVSENEGEREKSIDEGLDYEEVSENEGEREKSIDG